MGALAEKSPWGLIAPAGPVLHVGCGIVPLPEWLSDREEVRLDIDPEVEPDICASMTDMGEIGTFPIVACYHTLEHLYPYDVPIALSEFRRVLCKGGVAVIVVPDLEDAVPDDRILFITESGPITGHDLFYGHGESLYHKKYMAHHTGFIQRTLEKAMKAHFDKVNVARHSDYNLMGIGIA